MKLHELMTEEWYTADDIENFYQQSTKIVSDKETQKAILKVINSIGADERYDADDMEDVWKGIKKVVSDKDQRDQILKLIQNL